MLPEPPGPLVPGSGDPFEKPDGALPLLVTDCRNRYG